MMKFSLFAHMERTNNDQSYEDFYNEFIELCELAEQGGMHTIWTGEHHCMDFTIAPNPFINIADLAAKFKNIRFGTGTIIAPFWHPIKIAGESAMTDIITSGRLELGLARGAYSYEYERLMPGMDAWEAGARLREIVPAIQGLWKGNYKHDGEYYQFPESTSTPKPRQRGGPPIWIAARDPNSHEFAITNDCNVQVTPLWQGYHEVESLISRFHAAKKKYSQQSPAKIMLLQHTFVSNNHNELEQAANSFSEFYASFGAWFKNEKPVDQARMKKLSKKEIALMDIYSPLSLKQNLAIGSVDEIKDLINKYKNLGYDEFAYWIDSGMDIDMKKASLERFINEVMPEFV
jgi:alkanesulfonate monooxygenase SsuD/methylene tetrahydromethanopterin reductase-like flavin-dependent oxidoreductase (luciferase family)